jgi:hypothetical protein
MNNLGWGICARIRAVMTTDPHETAANRDATKTKPARAEQRLAVALRENLRRRKAQERGRRAAEDQRKPPD